MRFRSVAILAAVAANVSFLYGVAQMKMSVPYCREVVKEDIRESKRYQNEMDILLRPDLIDELMKK